MSSFCRLTIQRLRRDYTINFRLVTGEKLSRSRCQLKGMGDYSNLKVYKQRRHLSSSNGKSSDESLSTLVHDLSVITNAKQSKEISRLLSQSTREELTQLRKKILSESEKKSTSTGGVSSHIERNIPEPSALDLRLHAMTQAVPFVGFGIMDNAILIWAGDQIDTHLGVLFGISTLCAAAIGNIISDIAGVGLGTVIEDICAKRLKMPTPNLTEVQRKLRSVRFAGQIGNAIGLTVGCIIGMFPLLFIDTENVQIMKQDAHMDSIFRDVVSEAKNLIGAEATYLFLVTEDNSSTYPSLYTSRKKNKSDGYLYGKYSDGPAHINGDTLHIPISQCHMTRVALFGEVMNVSNVKSQPGWNKEVGNEYSENVENMLCVPVFDVHGNTIGVIQAINKVERGSAKKEEDTQKVQRGEGFTSNDAAVLKVLAAHISVSLQNMHGDREATLRDTIQILKKHGASVLEEK